MLELCPCSCWRSIVCKNIPFRRISPTIISIMILQSLLDSGVFSQMYSIRLTRTSMDGRIDYRLRINSANQSMVVCHCTRGKLGPLLTKCHRQVLPTTCRVYFRPSQFSEIYLFLCFFPLQGTFYARKLSVR